MLEVGQMVRLIKDSFPEERKKSVLSKKGYLPSYTNNLYRVAKVLPLSEKTANPLYLLEGSNQLYEHHELLPIPVSTNNNVPKRPIFHRKLTIRKPRTVLNK
jgi:hypothetical protein